MYVYVEVTDKMHRRTNSNIFIKNIMLAGVITAIFFAVLPGTTAEAATPVKSATGYVNAKSGACLRREASTSAANIMTVKDNTKVTIRKIVYRSKTSRAKKNRWYYVTCSGKNGYIRADLIDGIRYVGVPAKTTAKANCRLGAGLNMKKTGSVSKGKTITVLMTATAYRSSVPTWYYAKIGSSYRFVSGRLIKFITTASASSNANNSNNSTVTSGNNPVPAMSDSEYRRYLSRLGFPSSYISKLAALHKKHPNWVFKPLKTGIDFNSAVSKECRDGVSLIEGCHPIEWRDRGSNSFKAAIASLYKSASTSSSKVCRLSNGNSVTVYSEIFDKSKTKWTKVTTSAGKTGYTKESLSSQKYSSSVQGKVNTNDVNIRVGAGTNHTVIDSANKGDAVTIVLTATDKDGDKWYKIKRGSGYGYIFSKYVSVGTARNAAASSYSAERSSSVEADAGSIVAIKDAPYYVWTDDLSPKEDVIKEGSRFNASARITSQRTGEWYKLNVDGMTVYAKASCFEYEYEGSDIPAEDAPKSMYGITTDDVFLRKGAGTGSDSAGVLAKSTCVEVTGITKGSDGMLWYEVPSSAEEIRAVAGETAEKDKYYVCADFVSVKPEKSHSEGYTAEAYAVSKASAGNPLTNLKGTAKISVSSGVYIPKDGSNWFNASQSAVSRFMDPRNFLDETRIFMFEDLSYNSTYQSNTSVVDAVLAGTKLPKYGFSSKLFINAGIKYKVSPVHLAARARQETGGGSDAINGSKINGKKVYNPFNIGATSSLNPVQKGLQYAYNKGWTTQEKAVNGGASFIASGYINAKQNSPYLQKWNVANGYAKVATHQYMTNIMAPYYEAASTKNSYTKYGILNKNLVFEIPIFNNMP